MCFSTWIYILFNDVPRFRHNESGFSQISIFCGCVKSHGRVWKNESHGVISMVFVGRKPSCWKRQLYVFSSALPTSLFQPLLRQRSPRHLYMSLWQFLRHRKTQTHFMMLNKILEVHHQLLTWCWTKYYILYTIYYNHLQRSIFLTWSPSSMSDIMLNKILVYHKQLPGRTPLYPNPNPTPSSM